VKDEAQIDEAEKALFQHAEIPPTARIVRQSSTAREFLSAAGLFEDASLERPTPHQAAGFLGRRRAPSASGVRADLQRRPFGRLLASAPDRTRSSEGNDQRIEWALLTDPNVERHARRYARSGGFKSDANSDAANAGI
jgi:hypothetical protein